MRIRPAIGSRVRHLFLGLATLGSVSLLTACAGMTTDNSIVYAGFGGSYEESVKQAVFDPYSQDSGVKVYYDSSGSSVSKIVNMSEAGTMNLDLIDAEDSTLAQFIAADTLEPVDGSKYTADLANPDSATDYSIPWYTFSRNLFWNTDQIHHPLDSWADLFDTKNFPGTRGFVSLPWGLLEGALIADGVAVDDLYPLDVDRAFSKLDEIRDDSVFFASNGDLQNAISQGEIVLGYANLARIKSVNDSGAVPLDYTWDGAGLSVQQLVIPRGAPNQGAALDAIDESMTPSSQKAIMDDLGYAPSLESALAGLDNATLSDLPGTAQTATDETFSIDIEWWARNGDDVLRKWQEWVNQ